MGHRAAEEHVDHQGNVPFRALPRCCGVPDGHTHYGNDIGAVLRACREEYGEHQHRCQQRLPEGLVLVLLQSQIGQGKGYEAWDDEPQVGIGGAARQLAYQS